MTADAGIAKSIPAQSHTFMEIDHEIISTASLSYKVIVSYKRKYVHEVLVVKLAQEIRTDRSNMTIGVDWNVKKQTNQPTKLCSLNPDEMLHYVYNVWHFIWVFSEDFTVCQSMHLKVTSNF